MNAKELLNKPVNPYIIMKKQLLTIILLLLTINLNVSAQSKQDSTAINMVSYEQSAYDTKGTIALKNNTPDDIHNISFVLEYLDMQGNPMDYETYSYNIEIAPGMTKKLDIPAYEYSRNYHYYKTKDNLGHPAFKLRYELKDYNSTSFQPINNNISDSNDYSNLSTRHTSTGSIVMLLIMFLLLGIYAGIYVLVAVMAKERNRNPVIWLLLSFIATPLLICFVLLAIGKEQNNEY